MMEFKREKNISANYIFNLELPNKICKSVKQLLKLYISSIDKYLILNCQSKYVHVKTCQSKTC